MADFRISGASVNSRTEADIRLNYGDPSRIVAASNEFNTFVQAMYFSTDGGANWGQSTLPLATGDVIQSDPAVDWSSDGIAWALCIGGTNSADLRVRAYTSADDGATWTLDGTASGAQAGTDREILWVDHSATSPFKDQVYATWHTGTPVFFARRTPGTGGAWQAVTQLSGAETTGIGIGGDIKTNSVGDVFVFWPDADGTGNIVVVKSTNGGANFSAPLIIANTFANTRRLALPGDNNRKARIYISAGAYRTAAKDLVYAVWADLSGEAGCTTGGGPGSSVASTCKTRIWFSRSTDGGANWSAPVMLNNQASLNDQFHPKLCVDESNGNILVTYRDTVNDAGRLKPDVWMQTSTDDGQNWSAAAQVSSAASDETDASADPNQYGDYDGLTGFYGRFFPVWTDRRNTGNPEEIWSAQLSIVQKQCFFIVDRSTFGQDEVDAMLLQGSPTVNEAFYVVVEGFTATELGVTAGDLSGAPTTKPTLTSNPAVAGMSIGQPTALIAEDPTLPATPQRFTWVYPITFSSSAGFTQQILNVTLDASISTVAASAVIQLLQQPNPFESDGQTTWLSTDLRVFRIKAGDSKFNATVNGNSPSDAISFIQEVITNLNPGGNSGGQTFESNLSLSQSASTLSLSQFDTDGTTAIFNFAIAKVRYRAIAQDAQSVRVFFRLCPALTVSCTYDANDPTPNVAHTVGNVYRRFTDGVQHGQAISLLGTQNNNILTIPCFSTLRTAGNMQGQHDDPNVQTVVHNATADEIHQYFGCWLDINQPGDTWYPINPANDGPFGAGKKSILELVRNQHQCLLSEIVFDSEPIPNGAAPGTSDKIAQRNLAITTSANPGDETSRRIPNTFEIRPTPAASGTASPDELMILWGNTPAGSVARIYLPAVSADEIIEMASRRYFSAQLSRVDDHTIECPVGGITYIPIPPGPVLNHAGLLTIDLPAGVRKEQLFRIVVRQFTRVGAQTPAGATLAVPSSKPGFEWKKIRGTFQISIPVTTRDVMLEPEERLLSILRWILRSIPRHDRWYPVFQRYVDEIADRVGGLGGDPDRITPSPHGNGIDIPPATAACAHWVRWLLPLILAPLLVLVAFVPLAWAAPLLAFSIVLTLAAAVYWQRRCKPSLCNVLCALTLGISVASLILGIIFLLGYRGFWLVWMLALLGVINGLLVIFATLKGCCDHCAEAGKKEAGRGQDQ
jgi:hypothetical protein